MGQPITPLASLCLGVVRGWIRVASKGKGGQIDKEGTAWTRLPADQLRNQLEREFRVEVSTRSIHRALKELSEAELLRRQQRWKHRYRRDYWYAIPEQEEELLSKSPRSVSAAYQSERNREKQQHEVTAASGQVLNPHFYKNNSLEGQKRTKTKNGINHLLSTVQKCEAKGRKRPKAEGFGPPNSASGYEPDDRMMANTPKKQPIELDGRGKQIKEVWVGGQMHHIVD